MADWSPLSRVLKKSEGSVMIVTGVASVSPKSNPVDLMMPPTTDAEVEGVLSVCSSCL